MRVLLTGASGLVGSHILAALEREAIDVVALGRRPLSLPVTYIQTDLLEVTDFSVLLRSVGATHLLHLAWEAEHGRYWTSLQNLRWVEATMRLVEAFCELGGSRVVIAGTCAEYDWSEGYCREDSTPLIPRELYGVAKDATRRLVAAVCARYHVPCAWGRLFLPYGHGEGADRLIPSLIRVFKGQQSPFGVNAAAFRDFLHASDVATGFIQLLQSEVDGAFNISSCAPVRLSDLVITVASLVDVSPQQVLAMSDERPGEPPVLIGENLKLKALGWRPALSLKQGLSVTLEGSFR